MRLITAALLIATAFAGDAPTDPLDDALARAGTSREQIGFRPRSWWVRYPRAVPYRLAHFDGLFAEPLATVPFTRTMASTARTYFTPEKINAKAERGSIWPF